MSIPLSCMNLVFGYSSKANVFENLNFDIHPGEFLALLGENGSGKSTLLNLIMGFERPKSGSLTVGGLPCNSDPHKLRETIAYMAENQEVPAYWKVDDFLSLHNHFFPNYDRKLEDTLCSEFSIAKEDRFGSLSTGQRKRAQIIAALSSKPQLILIDEISAVLDISARSRFLDLLKDLNRTQGTTIVMATNIIEDIGDFVSHVMILSDGKMSLHESIDRFKEKPIQNTFGQYLAQTMRKA